MSHAIRGERRLKRLFWLLATLILPLINPAVVYYGSGWLGPGPAASVLIVVVAFGNFATLDAVARRAWTDRRTRRRRRVAGMFVAIVMTIPAIYVDILIVLWIASLSCPPNVYECPV